MSYDQQFPSAPPPPPGSHGYGYAEEVRPELEIDGPGPQRRLTVLVRWLLLIPQFIVLFFLGIAAFFVTIVGWFAALFTGRLPDGIEDFLAKYLAYGARVAGYEMLLVDRYPPFAFTAAPDYPVRIRVQPGELNRLAVLFRIILIIPGAIVVEVLSAGWHVISWIVWLVTLILGRMPDFAWGAGAAVLRSNLRLQAYLTMLTPAYPWNALFGDGPLPAGQPIRGTRPLLLDGASKALMVVLIVIGVFSDGSYSFWWSDSTDDSLPAPATTTISHRIDTAFDSTPGHATPESGH